MESLEDKVRRVLADTVALVDYDPAWPARFDDEVRRLRDTLPPDAIGRIEHFGSTAVPGLCAKPIVDILVEVPDAAAAHARLAPLLDAQGCDTFWRPSFGDDVPPFHLWAIRRDPGGARTHHLHFVEPGWEHWDRLLFRDWLIAHPDDARAYADLKRALVAAHPDDRIAYTRGKTDFVVRVTARAVAAQKSQIR